MTFDRKPIQVEDALAQVMAYSRPGRGETVYLQEADQRVLKEDIVASHPIPPFDKSPYDGFAFRSIDTAGATSDNPAVFNVIEQVGAGSRASRPVYEGEAVRIMTGAEIPEGADCVAMFEICHVLGQDGSTMRIKRKMDEGHNIMVKGSETAEGERLVEKGTMINPGVKALLATFGYAEVNVIQKPIIGLFATGSELLEVDEPMQPGKIRNSNAYMIASQIKRSGAEVKDYGTLVDDFDTSFQAVKQAIQEVDILITTGGVSVGDFDLMPAIYAELEADLLFNKIAMRPGSVTTAAVKDQTLLFGLSGNPSACYVGFELFVFPVIQNQLGKPRSSHRRIQAELGADFPKPNPFTRFVRSSVRYHKGKVMVDPAGMDKSAVVTSLARSDSLIILPGGTRGYQKGDEVEALLLEDDTNL
ncbi:gephyrin-like molybdotransferase Glp [Thalassobacillus sp. CUG 92003]|uniref:molybdopterin molybdotransferase MoeA n=1 Tax=Thalassobacillus sp. CUG 92003 TaxID=2736641 RepID=UPI0015E6D662|nr:gephyrin-like molybdotransferase Glp [Thalassobacillus sp. CUG 92003]